MLPDFCARNESFLLRPNQFQSKCSYHFSNWSAEGVPPEAHCRAPTDASVVGVAVSEHQKSYPIQLPIVVFFFPCTWYMFSSKVRVIPFLGFWKKGNWSGVNTVSPIFQPWDHVAYFTFSSGSVKNDDLCMNVCMCFLVPHHLYFLFYQLMRRF